MHPLSVNVFHQILLILWVDQWGTGWTDAIGRAKKDQDSSPKEDSNAVNRQIAVKDTLRQQNASCKPEYETETTSM